MKTIKRYIAIANCYDGREAVTAIRRTLRRLGGLLLDASVNISMIKELKEDEVCVLRVVALNAWVFEAALSAILLTETERGFLSPIRSSGTLKSLEEKLSGSALQNKHAGDDSTVPA